MNSNTRKIATGAYRGDKGAFWVWRFDDYYDIHFVIEGDCGPQGHDVIAEGYATLDEAVGEIQDLVLHGRLTA